MKKRCGMNCGLTMSEQDEKVMASIWCRGPGVFWSTLTPMERMSILFRKSPEEEGVSLLAELSLSFGECGIQLVELDMSEPDDIWPDKCPICKTDTNWDMDGFYKTYPHYKSPDLEDE